MTRDSIRIWSVLATVGDHIAEDVRLKKTVGRLATYLQAYGDVLVRVNRWDPDVLARFGADSSSRASTARSTPRPPRRSSRRVPALIPADSITAAATGTPQQCAATVAEQFGLGVNGVILHGATPDELAPILPAYREVRPRPIPTRRRRTRAARSADQRARSWSRMRPGSARGSRRARTSASRARGRGTCAG